MTPQAYCARLEQALSSMPPAERQEIIRYYLEFLEDASEDERSALGTPEELAQRILRENGIFPPDTAAAPPKKNSNRIAKWIILACTCYIWIPLLTTWYSLLLTALIVLAVIPIALCAALLGGLFTFVLALFQDVPSALMQLGMGLACGGVAALVAYPIWIACKSIVKFALFTTKKMWHFVMKGDDTPHEKTLYSDRRSLWAGAAGLGHHRDFFPCRPDPFGAVGQCRTCRDHPAGTAPHLSGKHLFRPDEPAAFRIPEWLGAFPAAAMAAVSAPQRKRYHHYPAGGAVCTAGAGS